MQLGTPKGTDVGRLRYDWRKIAEEYTNAIPPVSQADLCRKYGINPGTMCEKAKAGGWEFQRDRFNARLSEQRTEDKAVAVASEGKAFDSASLKIAQKGQELAQKFLDTGVAGSGIVQPQNLKDALSAARTAQQIGKDALGDKPDPSSLELLVVEIKKALA